MAKEPKIVPFGKYELLEKIAVGGMAEIFKARTKGVGGFEKYLAIKRILPHLSENKDFIDMLINEAKIAVLLSHANIVQIYDLGKIDDSYFIAMEFIEGKDLRALMSRCDQIGMPLFIQHAIFIGIEACKGLEYAHAKTSADANGPKDLNIVHRDISPQNVMISYEGEVKITDFGIAKANSNITETEAGVVKGKYEYMSPEQASGLTVDRRTDIFSTGIVLYEMLTGQKPFRGESDLTILERVREAKVDPPSKYNKSIPKKLEKIVLKALAKEAADRYQTATELKDDLTRFFYSSTFNFTTSNLAAFMKSIFAEEIKLDIVSDSTGIGKRPDLEDGRTISRIFGRPDSDRFSKGKNGTGVGASPLGAITSDNTNAGVSKSELGDSSGTSEKPTSSRTLGGEPLSIEEEINRILIPGKTNFGKMPAAPTGEPSRASNTASLESAPTKNETQTRAKPLEDDEKATKQNPVPAAGLSLGSEVQSAAMELAMEFEMAMPALKSGGTNARIQKPADDEEEPPTEAGRGEAGGMGRREELSARGSGAGTAARISDPDDDERTSASGKAVRSELTEPTEPDEPDPEPAPGRQREATIISPKPNTLTGSGPRSVANMRPPDADTASRTGTAAGGRASASVPGTKVPLRAVKEKVRGVTVNRPDAAPSSTASSTRGRVEIDREEPHQETIASAPMPRGGTNPGGTGSGSHESTVIGARPSEERSITANGGRREPTNGRGGTAASARPLDDGPSVTAGRPVPAPARKADRDTRPPSPGVTRLGPAADFDRVDDISRDYEAPAPRNARQPHSTRTSVVSASDVDDQSDLYPEVAEKNAGPSTLVMVAIGAIVFFFGVVLAKML